MAMVVEDGSCVLGSNAYVDIPYVSNYLLGEQLEAWEALEEPEQEAAIIKATRAVDALYDWLGRRKTLDQALSWPRSGVTFEGFEVIGVPAAVKKATAEAVGLVLEGVEFFSEDAGMEVASERVDVVAVTYRTRQVGEQKDATKFEVLNRLVRGLIKTGNENSGFGAAPVERV